MISPREQIVTNAKSALPRITARDAAIAAVFAELIAEYQEMRKQLLRMDTVIHDLVKERE